MSQIQLVSRGDLDVFLTGNPSITFFKSVYRKHTNFSMEDMVIGTIPNPQTSGKYAVKIPTGTGDLLYGTNLILKGNKIFCGNGVANISTAVIDNITFAIGSREIDKTYGHYLEVYHELNQENPNSTITNLGRIEDSSLYHLGHTADLAALATHKSMIQNNMSDVSYIDNNLAKPTNIMGHGLGYPPTHFQRSSKCGGTYCAPSYLQTQHAKVQPVAGSNASHSSNFNYVSSINTRPVSSAHVSGLNRQRVTLRIKAYNNIPSGDAFTSWFEYNMGDDDPGSANWINFNAGDKLKLVSSEVTAEGEGTTSAFETAIPRGREITVGWQVANKVYYNGVGGTSVPYEAAEPAVDATFKLTKENWSGRLMNASQVEESAWKGDILGECVVPLNFWYCRSPGLAIPLVALHKGTDVELYVQFAGKTDAAWTSTVSASLTAADGTKQKNDFISYDSNINCVNDVTNAYKIGDNDCKAILDTIIESGAKFNFNMDVSVIYIFLDNMERQRFKNSAHEYLIEQLQYHRHNSTKNTTIDISAFQHPVKELIWTGQPYLSGNIKSIDTADIGSDSDDTTTVTSLNNGTYAHPSGVRFVLGMGESGDNDILYGGGIKNSSYTSGFGNATFSGTWSASNTPTSVRNYDGTQTPKTYNGKFVQGLLGPSTPDCLDYCSYKISLNGTDRSQWKSLQHFTRENVRKYHKGGCISVPDSIAVFSFALNPTDVSPSGTCNFSNIDLIQIHRNQTITASIPIKRINVYAINYNILRFVNGQAGLSYVL